MADPAASIKSLYSGVGNFDSDHDDSYSVQHSDYGGSSAASSRLNPEIAKPTAGPVISTQATQRLPGGSGAPLSGELGKLEAPAPLTRAHPNERSHDHSPLATPLGGSLAGRLNTPEYYEGNSTNISLASASSDYQNRLSSDDGSLNVDTNEEYGENISRPMSPMSTTSALSTTATKDGIQGRRLTKVAAQHIESGLANKQYQNSPLSGVNDASQELHTGFKSEIEAKALPPITLNEKISMMNSESTR